MPSEFQRYRVLWPLVPAMAMVMIDFTIVSISATHDPGRSPPLGDRRAVAGHRLRALHRRLRRPRRPARRHPRPQADRRHRGHPLRRRLADVRPGPRQRQHRRALADHLPRPPGHRRRAADPLGDGAGARRLPPAERGKGLADLLHRRRPLHRDRADRRLLPDRVLDLAGDLLDQRAGGALLADRVLLRQAQRRQAPGPGRLARRLPDRRSAWPDRARHPAVDRMGLGRPGDDRLDRRRPHRPRRLRRGRAQHRGPADRRQRDDRQPPVRGRQPAHLPRLRPLARRLLLRQHVLPDRGRPGTDRGRLLDPDDVLFLLRRRPDRRRLDGQVRGRRNRSRSASSSARSG